MKSSAAAYVRTFLVLARSGLRERMHYKANFLITSLLRGVTALADFLIVAVILLRFRVVAMGRTAEMI